MSQYFTNLELAICSDIFFLYIEYFAFHIENSTMSFKPFRYYAIMYPLSVRWTKSRGPIIMITIWASAIGLSSFQLYHGQAERFIVEGYEFYDCTEVWEEVDGKVSYFAFF